MKQSSTVHETLYLAREKTITNAWRLLKTAIDLFEQEQYPVACFLAMTSIEEIGKLINLRAIQIDQEESNLDTNKLNKILRNHLKKAFQAAAWSLYINFGADQRHGFHRTSGIVLLARSGRWMNIRNKCLYTDVNLVDNATSCPIDIISREYAYYFICMGFEVLAEQAESGFGSAREGRNVKKSHKFLEDRLNDLKKFMEQFSSTVDLDKLDFLANPEKLQKEAENREKNRSTSLKMQIQKK